MRPRYRAWDKELQTMLDVSLIDLKKRVLVGEHWEFGETNFINFDDVNLMQSTGLFDKNGKEIFEVDIVKMAKDVYFDPTYYEIVRHRGGAYRLESNQHGCELWLRHTNCEVIGNIYENPELLEVE
ncbi:YopX family protein [Streptococcus sp. 400_SSPC]|uniref:YopX family protein n=1 Tax=Streptococcus sp. 400_SSPC TaxID=1579341 RepID=UPI00080B53E4|nr:YopX family protein [Streptococcus sp. 400_SSPC]